VKAGRHHTGKCLTWKLNEIPQNCRLEHLLAADDSSLQHPLSTRLRRPPQGCGGVNRDTADVTPVGRVAVSRRIRLDMVTPTEGPVRPYVPGERKVSRRPTSVAKGGPCPATRRGVVLGRQGVFGQRNLLSGILGVLMEKLRILTGKGANG